MRACAELFTQDLQSKGLPFESVEKEDSSVVRIVYDGRRTSCIFTGEEGTYLTVYTYFESIPEAKITDFYAICNGLNSKYKWLKFYIDDENDLIIEDDAILTLENAADETFELLMRSISIMQEAKPSIMRGIYS